MTDLERFIAEAEAKEKAAVWPHKVLPYSIFNESLPPEAIGYVNYLTRVSPTMLKMLKKALEGLEAMGYDDKFVDTIIEELNEMAREAKT